MSPRPRKPETPYQRRNRLARAKGYESYYHYRIMDNGRLAPTAPRPHFERLARARGHRSASDLVHWLRPGSLVLIDEKGPRDSKGHYKWVDVKVISEYGGERRFRLRGAQLSTSGLMRIVDAARDRDAVISPAQSLDIRALAPQLPREQKGRFQVQEIEGADRAVDAAWVIDTFDDRIVKRFRGLKARTNAYAYADDLNQEEERSNEPEADRADERQ